MNSARVKRHAKLMLNHPLEIHNVPLIIAVVSCTYMFSLVFFLIGVGSGAKFESQYSVNKIPVVQPAPVYNTEPSVNSDSDELLKMDDTDEELQKEMDELLMNLDTTESVAYTKTNTAVLGVADEEDVPYQRRGVPVEKRMYNDGSLLTTPVEPDINVITAPSASDLFSMNNVILPTIALGLAVLGVNYMENKALERQKLGTKKTLRKHKA